MRLAKMFKSARWRSEKNRIEAEFKLRFCATQVGWDSGFSGSDRIGISILIEFDLVSGKM